MTLPRRFTLFSCALLICAHTPAFGQLHNTVQKEPLKALGIRQILKTEVLLDDQEEPIREGIIEKIMVNENGYFVHHQSFDEKGASRSRYENLYQDTFLMESRYFEHAEDSIPSMVTQYHYDEQGRIEYFAIYAKETKLTTLMHTYAANGLLQQRKQIFHKHQRAGAKGGKETNTYVYNAHKQLIRMDVVGGSGKKAKKQSYSYTYDVKGRHIETRMTNAELKDGFTVEKRGFDPQGRLAYRDNCFALATHITQGLLTRNIPAGACCGSTFIYADNGLIQEEWINVAGKLRSIVKYQYNP